jgi:hypothetical protein
MAGAARDLVGAIIILVFGAMVIGALIAATAH